MKSDHHWRAIFGCIAFLLAAAIIVLALSHFVPPEKEQISLIVLGSVLTWPGVILAYYFGSSSGSKEKTQALAEAADTALQLKNGDPP